MKIIKEDYVQSQTIRNRESWLKILIILLFSFILAWKLATSSFNIDLSNFNFSDFLSLILALFAIALSALFYFKATEMSNNFYDNSYKFTKEVSEILGRIEAGFGERLRHLDEDYTGLIDKFDKIPIDLVKIETQVEEEEEEIRKKEEERNQLLEKLAEKAKLQDDEKKDIFDRLKTKENELRIAEAELKSLNKKLEKAGSEDLFISSIIHRTIKKLINSDLLDTNLILNAPFSEKNEHFVYIIKKYTTNKFRDNLERYGVVDNTGNLTDKGVKLLDNILKHQGKDIVFDMVYDGFD